MPIVQASPADVTTSRLLLVFPPRLVHVRDVDGLARPALLFARRDDRCYLQVSRGAGDVKADYSSLMPLADNPQALLDELNLVLAAGQLSPATVALMRGALATMASGTDAARLNRVHAALVLVLAAPEFIIQK